MTRCHIPCRQASSNYCRIYCKTQPKFIEPYNNVLIHVFTTSYKVPVLTHKGLTSSGIFPNTPISMSPKLFAFLNVLKSFSLVCTCSCWVHTKCNLNSGFSRCFNVKLVPGYLLFPVG